MEALDINKCFKQFSCKSVSSPFPLSCLCSFLLLGTVMIWRVLYLFSRGCLGDLFNQLPSGLSTNIKRCLKLLNLNGAWNWAMFCCVDRVLQVVVVEARIKVSSSGAAHKTTLLSDVPLPGSLDVLLWLFICPSFSGFLGFSKQWADGNSPFQSCCRTCTCLFSFLCAWIYSSVIWGRIRAFMGYWKSVIPVGVWRISLCLSWQCCVFP